MTELVCLLWVLSGHKCAEVHEAMIELSGSKHTTSEQHVELGTSRKSRDFIDFPPPTVLKNNLIVERTKKFKEYFKYELTQEPTSFKDGFMHESRKSDLKNIFMENVHNFETYLLVKLLSMEVRYFIKHHGIKIVLIVRSLINIVITYKIIMVHAL